jgi:hypothetical protein
MNLYPYFKHLLSDLGGIRYKEFQLMMTNIALANLVKITAGTAIAFVMSINEITLTFVQ